MIDEIPIIGVTEWTLDGLAAKVNSEIQKLENTAAKRLLHWPPSGYAPTEQVEEGRGG